MKAADVMTRKVLTVTPDASVGDAVRMMLDAGISGVPVVEKSGKLVGIVTEGDFLRRAEIGTGRHRPRWLEILLGPGKMAGEYVKTHARKVEEVMTLNPVSVPEDAPLDEIVTLMEKRRIKRVPVTRMGAVVGIVSRANLLRALASLAGELPPGSATDAAIRDRVAAELEAQSWAPLGSTSIFVHDGIVEMRGVVFSEDQRQAMTVAVENVPGVKAIEDHLVWVEPISGTAILPTGEIAAAAEKDR
jgi:CBS domain-containing protein